MMDTGHIIVLITTESAEEADKIATLLLERRKAACVNITDVSSRFWWEGKLDSAGEKLLIAKSRESLLPEIIELVRENHSYEVPEVIALPLIGGNPEYLDWIEQSTS